MSNTATELETLQSLRPPSPSRGAAKITGAGLGSRRLGSSEDDATALNDASEVRDLPNPSTASSALEKWNFPKSNLFRITACYWSLMVTGANDAAYGVSDVRSYSLYNG